MRSASFRTVSLLRHMQRNVELNAAIHFVSFIFKKSVQDVPNHGKQGPRQAIELAPLAVQVVKMSYSKYLSSSSREYCKTILVPVRFLVYRYLRVVAQDSQNFRLSE